MDFNELVYDSNTLEHYGRKGMKWGQHLFMKDPKVLGTKLTKATTAALKKKRAAGEAKILKSGNKTLKQLRLKLNEAKYNRDVYNAKKKKLGEKESAEEAKAKAKQEEEMRASKLARTKPKDMKKLSDADLKTATDRLNAEKKYKELYSDINVSEGHKEAVKSGKTLLSKLTEGGGEAVKAGAKYVGSYILAEAVNSTINKDSNEKANINTFFGGKQEKEKKQD